MVDVPADVSPVNIIKVGKGKLLVASDKGHGLIVDMDSALAQTRSGKQVLNLPSGARAVACCPAEETMLQLLAKQVAIDFPSERNSRNDQRQR